jgi:hypothetical protein
LSHNLEQIDRSYKEAGDDMKTRALFLLFTMSVANAQSQTPDPNLPLCKPQPKPNADPALLNTPVVQNSYWAFDNNTGSMVRMYDSANGPKAVILGNGAPLILDAQKVKDSQIKNGKLNVDPSALLVDVGTPGHPAFLDNTEFEYLNFEPVYSETSVTFYIAELVGVNTSHEAPSELAKSGIESVLAALVKADEWAAIAAKNTLTVEKKEMCRIPTPGGTFVIAFHSLKGKSQISITLGLRNIPSLSGLSDGQTLYFYPESIPLLKARFESAISAIDTFVKQRTADEEASKRETARADALLK